MLKNFELAQICLSFVTLRRLKIRRAIPLTLSQRRVRFCVYAVNAYEPADCAVHTINLGKKLLQAETRTVRNLS